MGNPRVSDTEYYVLSHMLTLQFQNGYNVNSLIIRVLLFASSSTKDSPAYPLGHLLRI